MHKEQTGREEERRGGKERERQTDRQTKRDREEKEKGKGCQAGVNHPARHRMRSSEKIYRNRQVKSPETKGRCSN